MTEQRWREIRLEDLKDMARGAAVLGTGGGGDPLVGRLLAEQAIRANGPVRLVDAMDLPDDAVVIPTAYMGSPSVMLEKIPSGQEVVSALHALEDLIGRKATHTISIEAGGINSMIPFAAAAELGLPLVDGDGMGRAFPELQMLLPTLAGISATPLALADERGNSVVVRTPANRWAETFARSVTVDMGCSAAVTLYVLSGKDVKAHMVHGTLSLCQRIGVAIREAGERHRDPVQAAIDAMGGRKFFQGKVIDVERGTNSGFNRGCAMLDGLAEDLGARLALSFQNEHLVAVRDGVVLASVPDLICVLDTDSGEPITAETMRYGLRVSVLAAPCDPRWRTPQGLALVGPRYFGYEHEYVPV